MSSLTNDLWLGEILGKPAYRVEGAPSDFGREQLPGEGAFLEAKVDTRDVEGLVHLQELGFRVTDCNITFYRGAQQALDRAVPVAGVEPASATDEVAVRALAAKVFEQNRFHRDPQISDITASRIKEQWAGNYFSDKRGEWMFVCRDKSGIGGFVQLLQGDENTVVIDLIAVAPDRRRQGFARTMIEYAARNCLGRPANMLVGTQLGNHESIRFYQSVGFVPEGAMYNLHRHS